MRKDATCGPADADRDQLPPTAGILPAFRWSRTCRPYAGKRRGVVVFMTCAPMPYPAVVVGPAGTGSFGFRGGESVAR